MECYKNLKTNRSIFLQNYLIQNYSTKSKNDIIEELGLSWNYIQRMTHYMGIKRGFCDSPRSLIKLINLTDNISCYWLGFLLADGHISKNNTIEVNINIKDEEYFNNIQNHLNTKLSSYYIESLNTVRFSMTDKQTILIIKKIFNWKTNKTKNIPTIPKLKDDQLFSLIIGFIDGDGSIHKYGNYLKINCDKSWKNILENFYECLTKEKKIFNLNRDGTAEIRIHKIKILEKIKNKAKSLELPIMLRKWNRIIDNRVLRSDKYLIVKNLFVDGKSTNEIIKETKFSHGIVYKVKKDLNLTKRLNKEDILKIRQYYNSNTYSQKELSIMFNVKYVAINRILHYKTWKNI